jgi:hypothetical protein
MEFVLTYLAVAAITTVCLMFVAFGVGAAASMVVKEKALAENRRWHPSEN